LVIVLAHHEKTAFLKFFLTYFVSVALLILVSGFFYFEQMSFQLKKAEHFSLIAYARSIKMGETLKQFSKDYHYKVVMRDKEISISNFQLENKEFTKYLPTKFPHQYLQVFKSSNSYNKKLSQLKQKIIFIQLMLLFLFAFISYILARNALKPLNESIETLDKFAKDMIHDINTPLTAMKLNIKLLQKNEAIKDLKPFIRLQTSADAISELKISLTTLLEKKTFQIEKLQLCKIVNEVIDLYQPNYPTLHFYIECKNFTVDTNHHALKQILNNLISNACKYNKKDGYIKIYTSDKTLFIEDCGAIIEDTNKIFQREYSTQNSTGFGLDIVKRLCEEMKIKIDVTSSEKYNRFTLVFP
jgi:two-component system OmpR family sensor kinase